MLKDSKLRETQKRLEEKNLSKALTVLLHGAPGTGKTEVVKQIAKETNREVMKVDISQSKSMWFGQSEKIIKKIFTDYRSFAKELKKTENYKQIKPFLDKLHKKTEKENPAQKNCRNFAIFGE